MNDKFKVDEISLST